MNSERADKDRDRWFQSTSIQLNSDTAQEAPGHIGAWALWLVAAALPALTTRNPAYLLLLLLAVAIVQMALPRAAPRSAGWSFFLKTGLLLWLFTIPLNALTVHHGETVLFSLPGDIPLIGRIVGGPITLEAITFGFLTGLGLLAVLLVFVTFNQAIDPYRLMRAVPAVFFQTGVVTSIALSFVPQAAVALREIREAQAIRGHRWRGLRDLVPLALPLLTTALERALQLAESMEARGFGITRVRNPILRRWAQRLLVVGLLVMLGGLLLRGFYVKGPLGSSILFAGGTAVVAALILQNQSVLRSRYRRQIWTIQDQIQALSCGLAALAYLAVLILWPDLLSFYPYPRLHWPDFQPALGLFFLILTAPAWFILWRKP